MEVYNVQMMIILKNLIIDINTSLISSFFIKYPLDCKIFNFYVLEYYKR